MRCRVVLSLVAVFLFWAAVTDHLCGAASVGQLDSLRNVLLLNSYNQEMTWVEDIVRGVDEVLQPELNNLTIHIENMDTKVFFSPEYLESFLQYLRVKYRSTQFSLILSSDNNAYDFLREHRDTLFPGVPVSFCGVNDFQQPQLNGLNDFTGVAEIFSARETVEMALRHHPETTEIFIVNDYLKTGRAWARDIDKELEDLTAGVTIRHSRNLSLAELQEEIASLSPGSIVLLGVFFADRDGLYYTYERIGALISEASEVPVYCLLEFNVGKGVVGGQVISGYYQGKSMAEIGRQILDGADAGSIPVKLEGSNRNIFDYVQLKRFDIGESRLPANSSIINRQFSFYREYKSQVWMVLLFICSLVIIIITLFLNITRRKVAERELQDSEIRFRQLANATWEAIVVHDRGKFYHGNEQFYSLFGYENGELDEKPVIQALIAPESIADVTRRIQESDVTPYEAVARKKNGETFPVEIRAREMEYAGRDVRMAAIRDLSGRKRMEQQLFQSQKLEAIGTLAGGIAHDFNNILSAIIGYCELAHLEMSDESPPKKYLGEILKAGNRAKELVQQILTFARKSVDEMEPIEVAEVVSEALKMLRASLPTSIAIDTNINSSAKVLSDPTKIHQVLMNLCTNAAKAMKNGGTLTVSLEEELLDQEFISQNLGYKTGVHVKLSVADTGTGIPPEDLAKIFDPFFTTRPKGEGSGLGLSVVHGIVRDCHGLITVHSEPGEGSEFCVYLPVVGGDASHMANLEEVLPGGSERILLVDDETMLVEMMQNLLTRLGYHVTSFTSSVEALHAFNTSPDSFDLVISDMTMPVMSGDVLATELIAIRPDIPIILNTGFTDKISEEDTLKIGIRRFVMKPVEIKTMAPVIREVLSGDKAV